MFIRYICKNCGQKCKSAEEYAGLKVNCAQCGVLLEIPGAENIQVYTIEGHEPSPVVQPSAEVQKLQQENQSLRMENVEITVQRNKYKADLDSTTAEIASLKKEQATLRCASIELLEMQKQAQALKNEIAELNAKMCADINEINADRDENQQLNEQLTKIRSTSAELNDKCAKLSEETDKMQRSVNVLEMDRKNLNLLLAEKDKILEHLKEENNKSAANQEIIINPHKEALSELKTNSNMIELMSVSDKVSGERAVPAIAIGSIEISATNMTAELQPEKKIAEDFLNSNATKSSHSKDAKGMEKKTIKKSLPAYTVAFMLALVPLLIVTLFVASRYKANTTKIANNSSKIQNIDDYRKAAEQGDAEAQTKLGMCYYNGNGVPKDNAKALFWFEKAADGLDDTGLQYKGYLLCVGIYYGDEAQTVRIIQQRAQQGDGNSQLMLAGCYANGMGVSKNIDVAAAWYRIAMQNDAFFLAQITAESRLKTLRKQP